MKRFQRILTAVLALCIVMGMLPFGASALTMGTKPNDGSTTSEPFPQGTGGSQSFRIPALVTLSDGTLVAAADARWNTCCDGGGLDTIVARSTDNGLNWDYTFANYLGDNGDVYNGSGSTAFIDPALAVTDDDTIYMLVDLYPYGVALNGSGQTAPSTSVGFNSDGKLFLSGDSHSSYGYYLDNGMIYSSDGTVQTGYTVDAYFNLTGNGYNTNLFFSDSPFKVVRTGYLYLTKSTDKGATWSAPELLNLKTSSEQVCLVGPGRGLVTSDGTIVFPCYSYNGTTEGQRATFIYLEKNSTTWKRCATYLPTNSTATWSSESAVVELSDGTLRFFFRNGSALLCYADYSWTSGWSGPVSTGIAVNSNTQLSAITYSKTIDGKQVILVSCPTGPNEAGSSSSSGGAYPDGERLNGKIFAFTVEENKTLKKLENPVSVNSGNAQFMYSCLTELKDGRVAVLYEDMQSGWVSGYFTTEYKTYNIATEMALTFDSDDSESNKEDESYDKVINVRIPVGGASETYTDTTGNYETSATIADTNIATMALTGKNAVAATGINLDTNSNVSLTDCLFTFTKDTNDYYVIESNYIPGRYLNNVMADASATVPFSATAGKVSILEDFTEMFRFRFNSVTGSTYGGTPSLHFHTELSRPYWNRCGTDTSEKCCEYLYRPIKAGEESSSEIPGFIRITKIEQIESGQQYLIAHRNQNNNYYVLYPGATQYGCVVRVNANSTVTSASTEITFAGVKAGTTSAIVGTTKYNITVYEEKDITINYQVNGTTVSTGTLTIDSDATSAALPTTVTDAEGNVYTVDNATLNIVAGTTSYNISVTKLDGYVITLERGDTLNVSPSNPMGDGSLEGITLTDGQYVRWSTADSAYVGVGGQYDATKKTFTEYGTLKATQVTEVPIRVTGTIYNADGTVAGAVLWNVSVTERTSTDTPDLIKLARYVNVDHVEHCTLYYSLNGGELVQVNGSGISIIPGTDDPVSILDGDWYGNLSLIIFAAPEPGYLMANMFVEHSDNQYYRLSDGVTTNGVYDITTSTAWPLLPTTDYDKIYTDANGKVYSLDEVAALYLAGQTTVYGAIKEDWDIWEEKHGLRWALLEGNMSASAMQAVFEEAYALGCTAVTNFTRAAGADKDGETTTASNPMSIGAVAAPLPSVSKEITSIKRGTETITGDALNNVVIHIGDEISYKLTVTIPKTSDFIQYWNGSTLANDDQTATVQYHNIKVTDTLYPTLNWTTTTATSTTSDQSASQSYSITLAASNWLKYVTDGKITNSATVTFDFEAALGKGGYSGTSSTTLAADILLPTYVIDFGLPITVNLKDDPLVEGYDQIQSAKAKYGDVTLDTVNGLSFTYTPTSVLNGVEFIELKIINSTTGSSSDSVEYGVLIYPATTVYYEEGFADYSSKWIGTLHPNYTTHQQSAMPYDAADSETYNNSIYGFDSIYALNGITGSYGTQAISSAFGSSAEFSFTGTGVEIYANCDPNTDRMVVMIKDSAGKLVRFYQVHTNTGGGGDVTAPQNQLTNAYSLPVVSVLDLPHGSYTVTINHGRVGSPSTDADPTNGLRIDGFRVHGTLDPASAPYISDGEANPQFLQLRDEVLYLAEAPDNADGSQYIPVSDTGKAIVDQVYSAAGTTTGAVYMSSGAYRYNDLKDLLDNGPKNELYLYSQNDSITFTLDSSVTAAQIGLKAVNGQTGYSISVNGTNVTSADLNTCTDMFYKLNLGSGLSNTIVITNTRSSILSITLLKYFTGGEATPALAALTAEDMSVALYAMGYEDVQSPVQPEKVSPFTDVGVNSHFFDAILWAYENNITKGKTDTTFAPESNVTRAQFVTLLWRAAGEPEPTLQESSFTDVPNGKYYTKAVLWAVEKGITIGTTKETFSPDAYCTRSQVVMFLYRYAGKPDVSDVANPFTDVTESNRFYDAILWAYREGITLGKTKTTFAVESLCTRAQVVAFLYRFLG